MAIFIAKGKIYVVPCCDIRNYSHALMVQPKRVKRIRLELMSLAGSSLWVVAEPFRGGQPSS
jgi:hypothetical protein